MAEISMKIVITTEELNLSLQLFLPPRHVCVMWTPLARLIKYLAKPFYLFIYLFIIYLFIYLFIYGCVGSSLLRAGFL